MLRQFIACKTRLERLRFFQGTTASDWDIRDLDTVMAIMGLDQFNKDLTPEQKYMTVYSHLSINKA